MIVKLRFCKYCGNLMPFDSRNAAAIFKRFRSTALKEKPAAGQKSTWKPVIGLEIHAQIKAEGKLFSGASSKFGSPVNTQVAFLDCALPGTLPVLSKRCVEAGVITSLALRCTVNKVSRFDRKHYFYADLPAGYQITQQNHALANNGEFRYMVYGKKESDCKEQTAKILQLQLEQDSGKSLHDDIAQKSLIDLNRAGCALMEIVTAPDFSSGLEARSFVRDLRLLLVTLGTCDGKMSEGSLRVDANISVHRPDEPLGVRTEVKNLNSLNSVRKAIDFEIQRQIEVLGSGGVVENETRSFDVDTGETLPMRDKEAKQDYRFIPEPNLPPLRLHVSTEENLDPGASSVVFVDKLESQIPVLPSQLRQQLIQKYGLNLLRANMIVNGELIEIYEQLVQNRDVGKFTTFLIHEILGPLNDLEISIQESGVEPEAIGALHDWYQDEKLSLNTVKKVVKEIMEKRGGDPKQLVDTWDLWQINDEEYLTNICKQILEKNPNSIAKYKRGKTRALNKLMGEARELTKDKGNLVKISNIFKDLMSE